MDIVKVNDLLIEVSSENTKLHLKNERLENNWNKLKKWLQREADITVVSEYTLFHLKSDKEVKQEVLDKMQEIEKSGKND